MENLNYGVIGNCQSAALVSQAGSIDWCCLPDFESPSVFAALLDPQRGGRFAVYLHGGGQVTQSYLRRTNVLVTRFDDGANAFELIDFMPRYKADSGYYHCPPDLIRYVRLVSGRPRIRVHYAPRIGYARYDTHSEIRENHIRSCTREGTYDDLYLYSDLDLPAILAGTPLELTRDAFLLMSYNQKLVPVDRDYVLLELERTKAYWMGWIAEGRAVKGYREEIERSALVLKLLAFQKTGAILAALTTSLPEDLAAGRNWDYRYCWIRDASMTVRVLAGLGHYRVAHRYLKFILDVIPYKDERIQIVYGIRGQRRLGERELPWLAGYENSHPVRVGNAAYKQKQNDIYGVLMNVIYQDVRMFGNTLDHYEELWTVVRELARHVENNWTYPDRGIWEFRGEGRHFTFSKVLSWLAMDRAAKIAQTLGRPRDAQAWAKVGQRIRADVLKKGWNPTIQAFTQAYGDDNLDAANLLMADYRFLEVTDPLYVSTVRLTYQRLCRDGLMYRYRNRDDFGLPNSSFTGCTFWMIKSLHHIGEKDLARELFERVLQYGNHLGLFSEDIDFQTKRLLGNFPQAYSHLALIDTAIALSGEEDVFEERRRSLS